MIYILYNNKEEILGTSRNREWLEKVLEEGQLIAEFSYNVKPKDLTFSNGVLVEKEQDVMIKEENKRRKEEEWRVFRLKRNKKLAASDKFLLPDVESDKKAWTDYRKALRDLPDNILDPKAPAWPEPPKKKKVKGRDKL